MRIELVWSFGRKGESSRLPSSSPTLLLHFVSAWTRADRAKSLRLRLRSSHSASPPHHHPHHQERESIAALLSMADASSSGSGARTAVEIGAAQLEARERLVSKSLKSSREKLWVQSQAFAERSRIRTARGDHAGALRDAKRSLALFPNRVEVRGQLVCWARDGRCES